MRLLLSNPIKKNVIKKYPNIASGIMYSFVRALLFDMKSLKHKMDKLITNETNNQKLNVLSKNTEKDASELVGVVRDVVKQELSVEDDTAVCLVESVNADGTLNLYVLPDKQNILSIAQIEAFYRKLLQYSYASNSIKQKHNEYVNNK